jgi:hypothetical protein
MNYFKQKQFAPSGMLRRLMVLTLLSVLGFNAVAQVTVTNPGNTTPGLAATYTSLANAITALNAQTAISGPVTIAVDPANPQTSPSGGYAITAILTGASATNLVTIDGGGNTITAPSPAGTSGALNDAFFKFIGSDFMTLQNFVMNENGANTTTTAGTNNMVEWGVALLYATTTNGAQNITIQNNTITLNRTYQNTFGIYSNSTHSATAPTTSATATTAAGGNSGLKVYGNTISNVNMGIVVVGPTAVADANTGIDIGGSSALTGNTLTNYGTTGTFSGYANVSGTVNGILVRNSNGFNISYNSITSSAGGTTAGTLSGIFIPGASNTPTATFTNNINNNTFALQGAVANGAINGINYPSGSASTTSVLNVNNNNFTQLNHSVAASGTITAILMASNNLTTSISNNTFTNITTNTTGSFTFISQSFSAAAGGTKNTNGNSIVTGFSKTGSGGTVAFIVDNGSTPNTAFSNCQNNNFSNGTLTGSTTLSGISYTDGGTAPARTVSGNTVSNWTGGTSAITCFNFTYMSATASLTNNIVNNINGQGSIVGINIGSTVNTATQVDIANNSVTNLTSSGTGGAVTGITCSNSSTTINVNNNTVSGLSSTAGSAVQGIVLSGGSANNNIFANTVCNLSGSSASSTVLGIVASAGTNISIYNNRIADLRAPSANAANPIIGLNIPGGGTANVTYNSVYLDAAAGGALFGSSAVSVSTLNLTFRNNIFVNISVANGAGRAVSYRRSTTLLTPYSGTSNNNIFYSNSAIFTDGTNTDVTFAAYQSRVSPRDAASFSENPPFLSTACGNADFLKINTLTATQAESGGTTVGSITTDFEGDARNGSTPDIGADEFAGILGDGTPPLITYSPLTFTCGTGARTLTASITDLSGVPTAGPGLPVLYWSINNIAGPFTSATGTHTGGSNYDFTFGSGVSVGDIVYYYIVAQDNAGTPNVIAEPATGASGYSANPPAASTPPSGPSAYNISSTLSGTYTVGVAGTYTTLTAAVNAYNTSCLSGPVVFDLIDATYSGSETFPIVIGNNPDASSTNTLTIKPSTSATISGAVNNNSLIRFTSARYVIIDGSNSGGTDQSLTITNTSTTAPTAFSMVSMGPGAGVTNGTIKNCILSTGTVTTGASYGISIGATTPGTSQVDNDNVTIQNNTITGAIVGIYAIGGAAVSVGGNDNLIITGNTITINTTLATTGIQVGNALNSVISQNALSVATTAATAPVGISLGTGYVSSLVEKNIITNVSTTATGGYGGRGITVGTGTATSALTIANNFISGVNGASWNAFTNSASMGIVIGTVGNSSTLTTTAGGVNIYYNTVNMYGNHLSGGFAGAAVTTALYVGTGASSLDVRNNILVNSQNNPNGSGSASKNYAIYSAAANTAFTTINYNDYYVSGAQGVLGFISSDRTTLAAIVTGFGQNANSVNIAPVFTSPSDLHLDVNNNLSLDNLGVFISGVSTDIDGTTRSLTTPDMGADEFSSPTCAGAVGGTASGSTSFCNSGTPTITATGYSSGTGSTYQWVSSANAGDYPLSGTPVGGQTNPATLTTGLVSTTTYYWLSVTCATNTSTDYSNMITITINPSVASISGPSSKCTADPAVTLTENGGTGTSWLWSTSETTQSISVNPSSTTTYTVTVTSPGSCTATATHSITVTANPTGVTAASDLSSVCNGGSINLTSSANSPSPNILAQDFESGIGSWTIAANSTGGVTPALANFNIRAHGWASGGSTPVVMNSPGASNFIFADPDGAGSGVVLNTQLTSPSFSTVGFSAASLDFRHYYRHITTAQTVQISTNGGGSWTTLQTYSATAGLPTAFANASISLNAYLGQPNVQIRFNYVGGWIWYWAIDDIAITGTPIPYSYSWASSPSGFTSAVQNPTGVTPTVSTDYTVTVTGLAGCTATASTGVVTVNDLPTATISGDASICSGNSTILTLNFTGTAPWTYAINGGSPATTSNNPETVSVSPVSNTVYTITSLSDANCSGSGSGSATINVSSGPPTFLTSFQSAPASACNGNVVNVTLNPVAGADEYTWSVPAGTLINGQAGPLVTTSNSVTLTLGALPANSSGWSICVIASNPCGISQNKCVSIRGALSTPSVISGPKTACPSTSNSYSVNPVAGANSYTWSGTGGITFTGSGTSVTANFPGGFTSGNICVAAQLSCGYTGGTRCMTVSTSVPVLGAMTGPFAVCPGQTNLVYSIPAVAGAATYNWTIPNNVTVNSGLGTNSVNVSIGAGFNIGNICVNVTSICGVVSPSRCNSIGSVKPYTPGNISGSANGVCNAVVTYTVPAVAGVTSYNWTAPAGATFVTPNGTNSIDVSFPANFTTGQLCVVAVNGCGSSPSRCINVKGAPASAGSISDPGVVCANQQGVQFTITPIFGASNYNWTVPAGVTIVAGQGTTTLTVDWGANSGVIGVTASNACGNSGTKTRVVNVTCRNSSSILPTAEVVAYPNPVSSELTVEMNTLSAGNYSLTMTDLTGRVMLQQAMVAIEGKNESKLDVSNYAKGVYLLTVKSESGFTKQIRVTVQ